MVEPRNKFFLTSLDMFVEMNILDIDYFLMKYQLGISWEPYGSRIIRFFRLKVRNKRKKNYGNSKRFFFFLAEYKFNVFPLFILFTQYNHVGLKASVCSQKLICIVSVVFKLFNQIVGCGYNISQISDEIFIKGFQTQSSIFNDKIVKKL